MLKPVTLPVTLASLLVSLPLSAHEFWIEPFDYQLTGVQPLLAEVRSGEYFEGDAYPYMPERIVHAELLNRNQRKSFDGRAGEFPALQSTPIDGLQIISYQSTPAVITHPNYDDFQNFLEEDGLQWVDSAHRQRQLPRVGFQENFTRYAKSLISVRDATGYDRAVGLPYELVVMSRLYDQDHASDLTVQLLADGAPQTGTQVTIFQKPHGAYRDESPLKLKTDQQGQVTFPVGEGGEFLVSAVMMQPGDAIPWHSHWTSVTFSVN